MPLLGYLQFIKTDPHELAGIHSLLFYKLPAKARKREKVIDQSAHLECVGPNIFQVALDLLR